GREVVAKDGNRKGHGETVIRQPARRISRDRGLNYGAEDFLQGDKREQFQADFTQELDRVCKENHVVVRSAFIRRIVIPETFLDQKRQQQIAYETKLTSKAQTETAQSDAEVEQAQRMIEQRKAEVKAKTARLVAGIERDAENVKSLTEAQIERMKAEYGAKIAELDGERERELGQAKAEVTRLRETAKSSLYKM